MMDDAIRELGSCIFEEPPHSWNCIWMLKVNKLDDPPLYFCDIAIFWNEKIETKPLPENGKWTLKVKNDPVDAELLIPPMLINDLGNDLQKLYRPNKSHILLQCKVAHDMD